MLDRRDFFLIVAILCPIVVFLALEVRQVPVAPEATTAALLTAALLSAGIGWRYKLVARAKLSQLARAAQPAIVGENASLHADEIDSAKYALNVLQQVLVQFTSKESQFKSQIARTNEIIENLPNGVVIFDHQGHITAANGLAQQLLGYKSDELLGKQFRSVFPAYAEQRNSLFVADMKDKTRGRPVEIVVQHRDGRLIQVDLTISQLDAGAEGSFIAGLADASQRKELERLKSEVVAVVSHDLKTPLTSVSANLTLLELGGGGELSDRGRQLVQSTQRELHRLMNLIKDILDVEKMEAGRFELEFAAIPLPVMLEAACEAVSGAAKKRSITIEVDAPEIDVTVDGERIVQVLVNLLANAVKFSLEGGFVRVSATQTGDWFEVKVIDHGRGIPEQFKQAVFEKFRQVIREDGRQAGGTGLGLHICKMIIEQHGGQIGFDSAPQAGTTFWFRLPFYAGEV